MRQRRFVEQYQDDWEAFARLLDAMDKGAGDGSRPALDLPARYRRICHQYTLARSRRYSPALIRRLEDLVWRGHELLYRRRGAVRWRFLNFVAAGFARALRRQRRYLFGAAAMFLLPALLMGSACYIDPEIIYTVMSPDAAAGMETMYDPANERLGRSEGRQAESDFVMFGYYIYNNIGIGFRTFAGGILLGAGTVFLLLFNGLLIGGIAGHLTRLGYVDTFWPFVAGHSALELTAIVVCGAAGLMLAHGLLAPGQRTRLDALRERAGQAVPLVTGAALMLLLAAFVEAFWSSSGVDPGIKLLVGGVIWVLVLAYFTLAGRGHGS